MQLLSYIAGMKAPKPTHLLHTALLSLFLLSHLPVSAQVVLVVDKVPANTPAGSKLYVTGAFNGWNPADSNWQCTYTEGLGYVLQVPRQEETVFGFKFTRGNWETEEADARGYRISYRGFRFGTADTLRLQVAKWRDLDGIIKEPYTASAQVQVLTDSFPMPQVYQRTRRVWLYLPKDYATSNKRYPVLYMHDGENLFTRSTAFMGEWGVDEYLDSLYAHNGKSVIVVGVDSHPTDRVREYTPYDNERTTTGDGDIYATWLATTLKPYIDKNYRTLSQPAHTTVMGSSMGGLLSMYCLIKHPSVFGHAGVLSPAFWVTPQIFEDAAQNTFPEGAHVFMAVGGLESDVMSEPTAKMHNILKTKLSPAQYRYEYHPEGIHSESYWRAILPKVMQHLYPTLHE